MFWNTDTRIAHSSLGHQLSIITGNIHSRAPGVATADYINISYLLLLALRVLTRVVMTE